MESAVVEWVTGLIGFEGAILVYLVYEFRWGRGAELNKTLKSFVPAIVILAQEVDSVDEEAIIESLPKGMNTPSVFLKKSDETGFSREEIDEVQDMIKRNRSRDDV